MTNQQRAEAKKMFLDQFKNCVEFENQKEFPGQTFWMDKDTGECVFNYDQKHRESLFVRYDFWLKFESGFGLTYEKVRDFIIPLAGEAFKKGVLTPQAQYPGAVGNVEAAFYFQQNKHEIEIPENHTAKVETVGGKVVVTFEPVQMSFTREEVIKLFEHALDMPDVLIDASGHNTMDYSPKDIFEMAEKHLQSQK